MPNDDTTQTAAQAGLVCSTAELGPVAEVRDGSLYWHIPRPTHATAQRYRTGLHLLYDQAAIDAARMDGVRSVQMQTAVIVRAALELLEAVDGCDGFPPEKMAAFRRVFGA